MSIAMKVVISCDARNCKEIISVEALTTRQARIKAAGQGWMTAEPMPPELDTTGQLLADYCPHCAASQTSAVEEVA